VWVGVEIAGNGAIRDEIAADRAAAEQQEDPVVRAGLVERAEIRVQVVEAVAEGITENKETALSVRVPGSLSRALKQRARAERVLVSALVRRLLADGRGTRAAEGTTDGRTVGRDPRGRTPDEQVEEIGRRVARQAIAG
jgi:hypothetical protein